VPFAVRKFRDADNVSWIGTYEPYASAFRLIGDIAHQPLGASPRFLQRRQEVRETYEVKMPLA
jgi:hypothetical protein